MWHLAPKVSCIIWMAPYVSKENSFVNVTVKFAFKSVEGERKGRSDWRIREWVETFQDSLRRIVGETGVSISLEFYEQLLRMQGAGPRYMRPFYIQFCVYAIEKWPFSWNLSSNLSLSLVFLYGNSLYLSLFLEPLSLEYNKVHLYFLLPKNNKSKL